MKYLYLNRKISENIAKNIRVIISSLSLSKKLLISCVFSIELKIISIKPLIIIKNISQFGITFKNGIKSINKLFRLIKKRYGIIKEINGCKINL
jgi:hypothetical protein